MKQLVTTEWLEKNINKVKILDATWCLPNSGRNLSLIHISEPTRQP